MAISLSITYIIIGITVLVSLYALSNQQVLRGFMMNPYMIDHRKQYYRFVTSGFIHNDHMHLLVNMFSFYFFGAAIEQKFAQIFGAAGGLFFVGFYILAIIVSDMPTYFKQRNNPGYNSLGASGGVSAIVFAYILFFPVTNICLYVVLCFPGFILGTLYVIYSYYQGKKSGDRINHDAHLFGALFGFIFCVVMQPSAVPEFFEAIINWTPNWSFLQPGN